MAEGVDGLPQASPGPDPTRRRRARREGLVLGSAAGALAALVVVMIWSGGGNGSGGLRGGTGAAAPTPQGVRTFDVASRAHVNGSVGYAPVPPVGGDHNPVWQNCGFYPETIVMERGVHSLEHGAVWITYRPNLPGDQLEALRRLAVSQTYILVSPWDGELTSPVVASAWGRQLSLSSATDPALEEFLRSFRTGPQTPEPGAPCTGGRSTPG